MFNLFRFCRKDEISFDIVAETGNNVAKNGNNVEATFDIVERIVSTCSILQCCWDTVAGVDGASTKLPVASTMLLEHCCWCGRGLNITILPDTIET